MEYKPKMYVVVVEKEGKEYVDYLAPIQDWAEWRRAWWMYKLKDGDIDAVRIYRVSVEFEEVLKRCVLDRIYEKRREEL